MPSASPVPITILTGFLGSGKSTLLNRILKEKHGWKIAVIMNEIGNSASLERAISIEQSGNQSVEWLEFANGCICCSVKDDVLCGIEDLVKRNVNIDRIIIETSGMADPSAIIKSLWADEALESPVELDGVVCLVDAKHAKEFAFTSLEAANQLGLADVIVINKIDLANEQETSLLQAELRSINSICKVHLVQFAMVPLESLFNLYSYRPNPIAPTIDNHLPTHPFQCISCPIPNELAKADLEQWLLPILWEHSLDNQPFSANVLRIKGGFRDPDGTCYHVQTVKEVYDASPINFLPPHLWMMVFIGIFTKDEAESLKKSFATNLLHN